MQLSLLLQLFLLHSGKRIIPLYIFNAIQLRLTFIEKRNKNYWQPFSKVISGVVAANGNTSTKVTYQFIDRTSNVSPEEVLYRLKMIDKDGQFRYSNTLYVLNNCKNPTIKVYPNPVLNGKLHVELSGIDGDIEVMLVNLSGQLVLKTKINTSSNDLNVSNIASGEYLLNLKNTYGFEKTVTVIIQH